MTENIECARFASRIDAYIDGEMQPFEREQMEKHAAQCPECAQMLREYKALHEIMQGMDNEAEVPPEASAAWRDAVRRESMSYRRRGGSGTRLIGIIGGCVAAALALAVGIHSIENIGSISAARSGGAYNEYTYEDTYALYEDGAADTDVYAAETVSLTSAEGSGIAVKTSTANGAVLQSDGAVKTDTEVQSKPVIIRSASRTVQSTAFDDDTVAIAALVENYGGWYEYRSVSGKSVAEGGYGRTMDATVRIPSDKLDDFLGDIGSACSVTYATESAVDVSSSYYDTASRLATLRAQHERLIELVTEAADLTDLLELEEKLYDVEYRIDSLEGELADWDSRAGYSEVSVTVNEVREYTEPEYTEKTLWECVKEGFADSIEGVKEFLQGLVVLMAELVPVLVIIIPVTVVVWLIVRVIKRRRRS